MQEVFKCSLPITYEHDDKHFPYSRGATCFLADYKGSVFAITANHAIDNNQSDIRDIRILAAPGAQAFLPLLGVSFSRIDESYGDIAILHVDVGAIGDELKQLIHPLDLNLYNRNNTFSAEASTLCLRGYPDEYYPFDYDKREMAFTGYYTEARYIGVAHPHCHLLEYLAPLDFESASGLSGSPVIHAVRTGPSALGLDFAGMLITSSNQRGQFIDSSVIYEALDITASNNRLEAIVNRRRFTQPQP